MLHAVKNDTAASTLIGAQNFLQLEGKYSISKSDLTTLSNTSPIKLSFQTVKKLFEIEIGDTGGASIRKYSTCILKQ